MNNIYFDHSATTPVDKKVLGAMLPYFSENFGNSSSIHSFGQKALEGIDMAREQCANFLNCKTNEIIFTSGATESNNLAIKGLVNFLQEKGIKNPHVITSIVEHDAVLEPLMELQKDGVEIDHVGVKSNGAVDLKKLKSLIKDNTVLISVMWVNSEVGVIMPIREIAKLIKKINDKRLKDWNNTRPRDRGEKPQKIYFHTDATQAANFYSLDVDWNYIDLLSMSAHKIYGPKGVGLLYRREGVPILTLQRGGHQEGDYRSGTLNVPGIVGIGKAIELLGKAERGEDASKEQQKNNKHIKKLRDNLVAGVLKNIPDSILNTDRENSSSAHAHFSFLGCEGESLLISLDLEGIAVSTGSACASSSLQASHVLIAMGIKIELAHNSIRFSLGKNNTQEDVDILIKVLVPIVKRIREINPLYNN